MKLAYADLELRLDNTLATHCNTLQHTTTHCNTLQQIATHCNTLQHTVLHCNMLQHDAACNTPYYTATCCNMLQHAATCYNMLQRITGRYRSKLSYAHLELRLHLAPTTHCDTLLHSRLGKSCKFNEIDDDVLQFIIQKCSEYQFYTFPPKPKNVRLVYSY